MRRLTLAAHALVAKWWRGSANIELGQTAVEPAPWPRIEAPTAALRMAARFPHLHLLPASNDLGDFAEWVGRHAPDADPDTMMDLYAEVCELSGWPAPAEKVAPEREIVAAPDATPATLALMPALEPNDAARRFANWVVEKGRHGVYLSAELAKLYAEHTAEIRVEPTPQNSFRQALARIPGISRGNVETVAMRNKVNRKERRSRSQKWHVYPLVGAAEVPFDLPRRQPVVEFAMAA